MALNSSSTTAHGRSPSCHDIVATGCAALLLLAAASGCSANPVVSATTIPTVSIPVDEARLSSASETGTTSAPATSTVVATPNAADPSNVYAGATVGHMSAAVATARPLVYVPSNDDGTVAVIDQVTLEEIARHRVGAEVQHVVPSHDLTRLYANASGANQLVPFDPATGRPGVPIPVDAPYNLYFSPDGTRAIVMVERRRRIDYYDPVTWKRTKSLNVPCRGVNHADWSRDLSYFLVTCEFSGQLLKLDAGSGDLISSLTLKSGSMPQDIRLSPDGSKFYVADMMNGGLWTVDGAAFAVTGFIPTGNGAHGIYPSRDATKLYVSNRGRGPGAPRPDGRDRAKARSAFLIRPPIGSWQPGRSPVVGRRTWAG